MERIGTYMANQALVSQLLNLQTQMNNSQTQINTGLLSQSYDGLGAAAFPSLNIDNQISQIASNTNNSTVINTNLDSQSTATSSIQQSLSSVQGQLSALTGTTIDPTNTEQMQQVTDLQKAAFAALSNIQGFLNTNNDGRYLFSGGSLSTPAMSFPYASLADFQSTFNGNSTVYPTSSGADLYNASFANQNVTFNDTPPTDGSAGTPYTYTGSTGTATATQFGTITSNSASTDTFTTGTPLTTTDFGTLNFSGSTVSTTTQGAFSGLAAGATLIFNSPGGTGYVGLHTVTAISTDGRSITVSPPLTSSTSSSDETITNTIPEGAHISIGGTTSNDGDQTVHWPDFSSMSAADQASVLSGQMVFTKGTATTAGETDANATISSTSYYQGDNLTTVHQVDAQSSVTLDINASNPAFEKAIRALATLAEGLPTTSTGAVDATALNARMNSVSSLMADAQNHDPTNTSEATGDITSVEKDIATAQNVIQASQANQSVMKTNLQNRLDTLTQADNATAITNLNTEYTALQASYAAMAKVAQLSLVQYL